MIWRHEGEASTCRISSDIDAWVYPQIGGASWVAEISAIAGSVVSQTANHETEAAAKAAVCHWIGKTMAQFSNALAAGCNEAPDDGN